MLVGNPAKTVQATVVLSIYVVYTYAYLITYYVAEYKKQKKLLVLCWTMMKLSSFLQNFACENKALLTRYCQRHMKMI